MIKDECIQQVQQTKQKGAVIDNKLSWRQNVHKISIRIGAIMASVKRCAPFINQYAPTQLFQALLLSNQEYSPTICSNAVLIDKLQKTQNKVARIKLKRDDRANVRQNHTDLKWLFAKDQLLDSLLYFVRNVSETQTPFILYNHLEFSKDKHVHNTRHAIASANANARSFASLKVRSKTIQRTIEYRGMYEWKRLHKHISQIDSKTVYTSILK